ncbi:MAG: outer membrane protein assembly factor, partial [Armatimonadota bacterium]
GDIITDQAVEADRRRILQLGYFTDVAVLRDEEPDCGIILTFRVREKQKIANIVFLGNTVLDRDALLEVMALKPNMIYDANIGRSDVARIEERYAREGYDARVTDAGMDQFGVWTIHISERHIKEVHIEGLRRTKEWVVRSLIRVKAGDLFRKNVAEEDLVRLARSGLFSTEKQNAPGYILKDDEIEPEKYVVLVYQVTERRTGMASFGGAWSSVEGFVGFVSVSDTNLFGEAKSYTLTTELGGRTSFELFYKDPLLDKKRTELAVDLFNTQRRRRFQGGFGLIGQREGTFNERRSGGHIRLARPFGNIFKARLGLRAEDISDAAFRATASLGDLGFGELPTGNIAGSPGGLTGTPGPGQVPPGGAPGPIVVSAPLHKGGQLRSVSLGGVAEGFLGSPRDLGRAEFGVEFAGAFLGGGADFQKYSVDLRRYRSVDALGGMTLAGRLLAGTTTGSLPLFESFIVGGAYTLRGYREDRFWGENMVVLNAEVRKPITDALEGVFFVDVGDAWGGSFQTTLPGLSVQAPDPEFDLHAAAGLGVRVQVPVLGKMRFDLGVGEEGTEFHFGIGPMF